MRKRNPLVAPVATLLGILRPTVWLSCALAACGTGSSDGTGADAISGTSPQTPAADLAPLAHAVDPFIGTSFSGANIGSTYPAATLPWGLCKAGPDTRADNGAPSVFHCGGYLYQDPYIYGFTHNRLEGTGVPDYGNIAVMPFAAVANGITQRAGHQSTYSHATERAEPGYYAVTLDQPKVRVEIAATTRCAHHRYTFLAPAPGQGVLIDFATAIAKGQTGAGSVHVADAKFGGRVRNVGEFSGRYGGFDVHVAGRFRHVGAGGGVWHDGQLQPGATTASTAAQPSTLGLWQVVDLAQGPTVEVQLCLSYVDEAGAQAALAQELPAWDFDGTRQAGLMTWQKALSVVEVQAPTAAERTLFYSSLYRTMQLPTIWGDVDGRYRGFDGQVHQAKGWTYVTDLSLWDTFRTENPLIVLLWPEVARDVLRSLVAQTQQGGHPPQWSMGMGDTGSMIGFHAASVAADAVVKGQTDFDIPALYAALMAQVATETSDFECRADYLARGYCSRESGDGSVSETLEFAYGDSCLASLASHLGKPADAAKFALLSKNYQNLWDPQTQFFRARHAKEGSFTAPFDPEAWSFTNNEYVEGTAWQWNYFAPHDPDGLRGLYPNTSAFLAKLQAFFQQSADNFSFVLPNAYYFQGNEPDILASSLFLAAGRADLADQWTRWVADTCYTTAVDGLVGNDDAGTLSAWYVWAALGLLPRPGQAGYDVVAPRYDGAVLHLPGGTVTLTASGAYERKLGGQATWQGKAITGRWLPHAQLAAGGQLGWQ
jgi:predicted alpha-1,2-mannosidase